MSHLEPLAITELAPVATLYHENSKLTPASLPYLAESVGEFSSDPDSVRRSTTSAKTYPGPERISLRLVRGVPKCSMALDKVLLRRRSQRIGNSKSVSLGKIASLLEHACGITGEIEHPTDSAIVQKLRAYPSGGALYPVEIYLVAMNVANLATAVYHYHAPDHCLETVNAGDVGQLIQPLVFTMSEPGQISALFVLTGRWKMPLSKYGERGYRVMLLDAGHVAQNLLLVATAIDVSACAVAGFHDDALAGALGLNPATEPPLYVIAVR